MTAMIFILAAFGASLWTLRQIVNPDSRLYLLDHPNDRSMHTKPTPRTGGVAIGAGILAGVSVYGLTYEMQGTAVLLILAASVIASLSFVDDKRGLSVRVRLLGHVICASLLAISGYSHDVFSLPGLVWHWPQWFSILFSVVYLVWMINLYNFMDGMDGFAAGMAIIGFGAFAMLGHQAGKPEFLAISLIIVMATSAFLVFNFPPARVFMGDSGSSLLGLLAGGMSIWGAQEGVFSFWVALLIFSPFIVDATATLLRRLWQGDRIWQAHRTHYYQRLVQSGWSHRKTVLFEYMLMLACSLSGVIAMRLGHEAQQAIILFWCTAYLILGFGVRRVERKGVE